MPKLKVMDSPALNAFASGLNRRQYSVTVTTGLLQALNDQEIEAVLGHELTHIRNGDVQLMVVAVIIAGVVGFFGELFFRMFTNLSWNSSGSGWSSSSLARHRLRTATARVGGGAIIAIIIAVALILLAWLLSQVVKLALSRSRELLADAGSVELTKNPDAMITALRKIENRGELPGATSAVMELCVDNPREGFADLFATHRRWMRASRRWCSLPAAMTPARWPCRPIRRTNPKSRRNRPPANASRRFPAARGAMPASPPAFRTPVPARREGPWGRHS